MVKKHKKVLKMFITRELTFKQVKNCLAVYLSDKLLLKLRKYQICYTLNLIRNPEKCSKLLYSKITENKEDTFQVISSFFFNPSHQKRKKKQKTLNAKLQIKRNCQKTQTHCLLV